MQNSTTKENETLLAVGTAYVQGEDVAARGRVLLFSVGRNADNPQNLVLLDYMVISTLFHFFFSLIHYLLVESLLFSQFPFFIIVNFQYFHYYYNYKPF